MATVVTEGVLREIASVRAENGCAISLYIDLDPSAVPTIPDRQTKFNALVAELEKEADSHGEERDCRLALREDIDRIRSWWDDFDRDGARGVAVFASSADGAFVGLPLADPAGDLVRVGSEFAVTPLVAQLGREGALVAFISRERGTVYRQSAGRLEEIIDESEDAPGQHSQGGWSQARYQRHIDKIVQQHLRSVGEEIDKRARRANGLQMVVVAPEEMRGDLEAALSAEARAAIVGWATAEAHAGPNELLEVARPLLDEARGRADEAELERWQEEHGRGGRAAAGWRQTLEAASDGRVDVLLLDESSAGHQAWQCPRCGRASSDGGKCPLDDARLEEVPDGAELAIHRTLAHGGSVVGLGAGALSDASGIAATLRF